MIFTIGHSTRALDDFIEMLRAHGVTLLVDVRRFPGSRRQPQFNSESMAAALKAAGITYEHAVDLGGRRAPVEHSPNTGLRNAQFRGYADHMATPAFAGALDRLLEHGKRETVAVMCAEAVPWRCHRSLLADAIVARGVPVSHIMDARTLRPHEPTKGAVIEASRATYPGHSEQPSLPLP
ncbi:MAG TPA: DUF488 domain-containing protein [Actinomycetota bacterium]|nr:DUF488 domain-containing protein [Actinomycetota bacterium]